MNQVQKPNDFLYIGAELPLELPAPSHGVFGLDFVLDLGRAPGGPSHFQERDWLPMFEI